MILLEKMVRYCKSGIGLTWGFEKGFEQFWRISRNWAGGEEDIVDLGEWLKEKGGAGKEENMVSEIIVAGVDGSELNV